MERHFIWPFLGSVCSISPLNHLAMSISKLLRKSIFSSQTGGFARIPSLVIIRFQKAISCLFSRNAGVFHPPAIPVNPRAHRQKQIPRRPRNRCLPRHKKGFAPSHQRRKPLSFLWCEGWDSNPHGQVYAKCLSQPGGSGMFGSALFQLNPCVRPSPVGGTPSRQSAPRPGHLPRRTGRGAS